MRTFADQAVIAIQNVELFEEVQAKTRDLEESLQQQTATADVLKVISRSAFDLNTVMDTLARSALDLCGSKTATLFLREGDMLVGRGIAAREIVDDGVHEGELGPAQRQVAYGTGASSREPSPISAISRTIHIRSCASSSRPWASSPSSPCR